LNRVVIRTQVNPWTGYGQIGIHLGRSLEALGIPVVFDPFGVDETFYGVDSWVAERIDLDGADPGEIAVQLAGPGALSPYPRDTLAFTMFESAGVTADAVRVLNRMRGVVVPCSWCAAVLSAAGMVRPLFVAPMGVDETEGFTYAPPPQRGNFVIGVAGRMSHGGCRKGLNEAMRAFALAFPAETDVELRVKVWPDDIMYLDVPDHPRIHVHPRPLRPREMAHWLKNLHVYLCPSKGEGWGLITHQAMAVGRPVIAARWSGTAEFWDDRAGYELEYDLEAAQDFYGECGVWAAPRLDSMIRVLRHAYARRAELPEKGLNAHALALRWTWDRTARALVGALKACGWTPNDRTNCHRVLGSYANGVLV
jgi:glycosyltransferase involved in cell wall biosynthesis